MHTNGFNYTTSRIKAFYGTSPNAVKTLVWIARSIRVVVAKVKVETVGAYCASDVGVVSRKKSRCQAGQDRRASVVRSPTECTINRGSVSDTGKEKGWPRMKHGLNTDESPNKIQLNDPCFIRGDPWRRLSFFRVFRAFRGNPDCQRYAEAWIP